MIQVTVLRTEDKDANALLVMLHGSQLLDSSEEGGALQFNCPGVNFKSACHL